MACSSKLAWSRRGRFRAWLKRWEMVDRLRAGLIIRFFGVIGGPFEGEIDTAYDRAVTPDDDPLFGRCLEREACRLLRVYAQQIFARRYETEEEEARRNGVAVEGEILAAHGRVVDVHDLVAAESVAGHVVENVDRIDVVERDAYTT